MHRWTASLLLLVMLVPAVAPLALARTAASEAAHCRRPPLHQTAQLAQPAKPCHHGMTDLSHLQATEASIRSLDCCSNHDCCRGVKTSEWARPASRLLKSVDLFVEPAVPTQAAAGLSADPIGYDAARAPPLG